MERVFPTDVLTKRQRFMQTMEHRPVDRVALHEQLSYNCGVIACYTGKTFHGFDYTPDDVGVAIRRTLDTCFPIIEDKGAETITTADGFVIRNDRWTSWRVSRPFADERGAGEWLRERVDLMVETGLNEHTAVVVHSDSREIGKRFDSRTARREYRRYMSDLQEKVGETVIIDFSFTGFCDLFDAMGLQIFTFFSLREYMEVCVANELNRVNAVADAELEPTLSLSRLGGRIR